MTKRTGMGSIEWLSERVALLLEQEKTEGTEGTEKRTSTVGRTYHGG